MSRRWRAFAGLAALLAAGLGAGLHAQAQPGTAPAWDELSAVQQKSLAPLRERWPEIDAARRQSWLAVASRMPKLPPPEQARLLERMASWSRLTPDQRGTVRLQFQEAQRWTPEERQARWQAYQSLHPQARQVLAERWKLEAGAAPTPSSTDPAAKRNLVEPAPAATLAPARAASPTSVRSRTGATTKPLLAPSNEPAYHQPGLPKVVATDDFVDPATLLPRRGPQAAAMATPPATKPPQSAK